MTPSPAFVTADEVSRELVRVADRLRALGGRLRAPDDDRLAATRATLQALADLAADAERRPRRPVPELAAHGLADQVLVLGHDALAAAHTLRDTDEDAATHLLADAAHTLTTLRRTL